MKKDTQLITDELYDIKSISANSKFGIDDCNSKLSRIINLLEQLIVLKDKPNKTDISNWFDVDDIDKSLVKYWLSCKLPPIETIKNHQIWTVPIKCRVTHKFLNTFEDVDVYCTCNYCVDGFYTHTWWYCDKDNFIDTNKYNITHFYN